MTNFPEDLVEALASTKLTEFFAGCTPAHQREYLKWIAEAKQPETRKVRIAKTMKLLAAKATEENSRRKQQRPAAKPAQP